MAKQNQKIAKTREQVEELKNKWVENPSFTLEETEGFEEFADELKEFAQAKTKEWDEFNQRTEFEELQKEMQTLRESFQNPELTKQSIIEVLKSLPAALESYSIELPEFVEYKQHLISWANNEITRLEHEILIEQDNLKKIDCLNLQKRFSSLIINDKADELEVINIKDLVSKSNEPEFIQFFNEFKAWYDAKKIEVESELSLKAYKKAINAGMDELKIIDFFAAQAMQSLYTKLPNQVPANQIAQTSYDIAAAMIAEKQKRGL
jgi:polyhydroxyalkanoate synthesis regulator phasin/uncharacterized protein YktA (UPF0223 family)